MDKYTIYCTEEQTKKALKLGAPIKMILDDGSSSNHIYMYIPTTYIKGFYGTFEYIIPTAEQMICWLEGQNEIDYIEITKGNYVGYGSTWEYTVQTTDYDNSNFRNNFKTRREATWTAIDAALEYLEKNKKTNYENNTGNVR